MKRKRFESFGRATFCTLALIFSTVIAGCGLTPAKHSAENENANVSEKARKETGDASRSGNVKVEEKNDETLADFGGKYYYKTKGRDHYENSLEVKNAGASKIAVYYEGVYIYQVGDTADDTMKEDASDGVLTLKGNTATGFLTREGEKKGCRVTLSFAGDRATLKSTDCSMNVFPDGVYVKETASQKDDNRESGALAEEKPSNSGVDGKIRVQYDDEGTPNAILNMMASEADRVGCEDDFNSFEGKVARVRQTSPGGYEFTLAAQDGKRKTFYAWVGEDISTTDAESVLAMGANLTVNYILCGSAGHPTPAEIFRR